MTALLLHHHRIFDPVPAIRDSVLRHNRNIRSPTTTTSADFCPNVTRHCWRGSRLNRQSNRSPWVSLADCAWVVPDLPPQPTDASWETPFIAGLTDCGGLISDSCSSPPRSRHQLLSDPASRRAPLLRRPVPVYRAWRRLSPPVCGTCQVHKGTPPAKQGA